MSIKSILRTVRSWIGSTQHPLETPIEDVSVDPAEAKALAEAAPDEQITKERLMNEDELVTYPPLHHLDLDEQPQYLLSGTQLWMGESIGIKADEVAHSRILVFITDQRVLLIVGKRTDDSVWQIPFDGIDHATIKYSDREAYFLVEAEYRGTEQTFFVKLIPGVDDAKYREIVRYVNDRSPGPPPSSDT